MNLSNCLKTLGIEETIDVDALSTEIQELQKQGLSQPESHARAVAARVKRLEGERSNILNQVGPLSADKGLGTKLNQKAAQDAVRGIQSNDLGPTSRESTDTLQAGVDAIGRGDRMAAYSADPKGFEGVKIPSGMVVIPSVDGGSYVTDKLRASEIAELDKKGQEGQAKILGYPEGKTPEHNRVARAKDVKGRTVQDVSFHDDDVGVGRLAAMEQGRVAAGRGGQVDLISPEDALNDRADQIEDSTQEQLAEQAGLQPEVEVDIKYNTTGNIIKALYGDAKVSLKNGLRKVTLAPRDPTQTQGDPVENHPLVIKAMAKVFDDGQHENRGRIETYNPTSKGGTRTRVSLPGVIALGKTLNRLNDVPSNRKADLLTGLGHMYVHNFIPMQVTVLRDGKHKTFMLNKIVKGEPTKLALPLDTVVDGRGNNTITFGQVVERGPKKDLTEEQKKGFIDKHDKLTAQFKAMTEGTPASKNKARMKHKRNTQQVYEEIVQLEKTLTKRGIKFKKSDVDPSTFEQTATTTDARISGKGDSTRVEVKETRETIHRSTRKTKIEADILEGKVGVKAKMDMDEGDTSGLPSEEQQAQESARDVHRKPGLHRNQVFAHRNGKVSVSKDIGQKLGNMAADIFRLLGIKSAVDIVGDKGAQDLIAAYKEAAADPQASKEFVTMANEKIAFLEEKLAEGKDGFVIYNDRFENAEDRVPTVYVSDKNTKTSKRLRVLVHELGHLVQRTMFDTAPKEVQQAIKNSMSGIKASTSNKFEENFANMLWRYLVDLDTKGVTAEEQHEASKRLRSIVNQVNPREGMQESDAQQRRAYKDIQLATRWFKKLAAKLRQMWSHLSNVYKLDEEYKEFMNSQVGLRQTREGITPMSTRFGKKYEETALNFASGPFMAYRTDVGPKGDDYTASDLRSAANRVVSHRLAKRLIASGKTSGKAIGEFFDFLNQKAIMSSDTYLRSLGSDTMTWIANEFHHQPGLKKVQRAFFEEVRTRRGSRQKKMNEILRGLPLSKTKTKRKWWSQDQVDVTSPEYIELMDKLSGETTISQFRAQGGIVGEAGVRVREFLEEQRQWMEGMGVPVSKRANYFPSVMDIGAWSTEANQTRIREIFVANGYTEEYANKVIKAVTEGDGYLADTLQNEDSLMGPSFNFMKKRKLSPEVLKALREAPESFMSKDLQGILQRYLHASVERGVVQKRWGLSHAEKLAMANEFTRLGIAQHMNSPVAKLHLKLQQAKDSGEITNEEFNTVKNRVLEAYFGRLGSNADPRWMKFQSMMIFYQNLRLLGLSTLAASVDPGQVIWRAGDVKLAFRGMTKLLNKGTREQLYADAHLMGVIEDDLTEHVLNDQTTMQFMDPKWKRINETFFRFILLHQWTNLTRVMGLSVAREFVDEKAMSALRGDRGAQADLAELGVTPQEIFHWQNAGRPMHDGTHANVVSALSTFIDEAVIRPDATVRPTWASDRKFQLFFHLKSFMYGYHEMIWKRIYNRAKAQPTLMKQLMHGGQSGLMLAALTLPLAIAGYEIRRLLQWFPMGAPESSKRHGWDYLGEMSERAGWPGILQFVLDANQAQGYGKSGLLSLGGPTIGQFEDFMRNDWVSAVSRSIPGLAQSGPGRAIFRDLLRGE